MPQKHFSLSYQCHEALGAELCEMYSVLGTMKALCVQHCQGTHLPTLARRAQVVTNALTVELDKQFQKDYPDEYCREAYYH